MTRPRLIVEPLTADAFSEYGKVLQSTKAGFAPVLTQADARGWLAGLNNVSAVTLRELHYHQGTWECFAPLSGTLFIAVSVPADHDRLDQSSIRVFLLSQPIAVAPHTPHCLLASSPEGGSVFVCENAEVTGATLPLPTELEIEFPDELQSAVTNGASLRGSTA